MEISEIKQGDRVTYAKGEAEYDAVALAPVTTGYNNAIRKSGHFLTLRYLDEQGNAVTISSAPLLGEDGALTGWHARRADEAKRPEPKIVLAPPDHEPFQPMRDVPPAVLGQAPDAPIPAEISAELAAAQEKSKAEMAAAEAGHSAPEDEYKIGDIVRFTPESGNDQSRTFTIDGGERGAGDDALWFWRLKELPGSLFLARSIELALPKGDPMEKSSGIDGDAGDWTQTAGAGLTDDTSALPTPASTPADSSSPTPAVADDQVADVATAAAPEQVSEEQAVADATGDSSAS